MDASPPDRYKRPFLVQLTPSESDLLDRLGLRHGTKRKAVVDGLRLLESDELAALRARVADFEQARATAASEAHSTAAARAADVGAVRGELKQATTQLRTERAALKSAKAELRTAQQGLATARDQLVAAQQEARQLAARLPHHAFCAACGKLVPEAEWAEQPAQGGGVYLYHQPHGFRPKAALTQGPSLLFWLATPREAVR